MLLYSKDSTVLPGYAASPSQRRPGYASQGRFFGKPLCTISRFIHQNAQTPPSPLVGEGGWGMRGMGARASPPASPRPGYAGVSLVCAFPPVNQATLRCIIKQPEDNIACRIAVLRLTPAGFRRQGKRRSHRGRFFGNPLRAISRFRHQNAQNPPSPLVGEGGWGDEGQRRISMQNIAHLSQKLYT